MAHLELTKPTVFKESARISAWFTRKNSDTVNRNGRIPGLNLGMNTDAGTYETATNLNRLLAELDIDPVSVARAIQVHSSNVTCVETGGIYENCDALVSSGPELALAIQAADCMVLLMADIKSDVIAAVHAGWRGAINGVIPKTVRTILDRYQSDPDDLRVYISPAICMRHFEVGEEVAKLFPSRMVERGLYAKPHIDLKAFAVSQLKDLGIEDSQIQVDPDCTWEDSSRYYSYRREGDEAGRMLGLISLNDKIDSH